MKTIKDFYNPILDNFPSLIWMSGLDAKCVHFNNTWLKFTGRTLQQEIGDGWVENVHKEDLDRCIKIYSENFNLKKPFTMEYRLKHNSGKYRWIQDNGMPLFDEDGTFKGYLGGCFDIQDIKDSEEKNKKFSRAVEQSPLSIVITDINGTIEYVNPKFTELTGYSYDEAIGKNPRVLKSGRHDNKFYKELWDTILSGNTWRGEIYNLKKDQTLFIEEASINPVKNDDGKITNFVAIKQDITKRKADEKELENTNKELEKFNKLAVDRELKMIEMKNEIKELKKRLGEK